MKKILGMAIFFLLSSPALAEEPSIFLTNQNGDKTTQFEKSDEIYIEGICAPATQELVKIYIAYDKTWQADDKLSDVSAGIETLAGSADGRIPRTKIWKSPLNQGSYDVIIDANNDFTLQDYEQQCVIGITDAGFRVGSPPPPVVETPPPPPPPPPVSASAPTPPPPPAKPSVKFSLDGYVETESLTNVRKSAGGTLMGTQAKGAVGVVIGGPTQASLGGNDYWFWNVNFENNPDGWVSESMIKSAPAPAEENAAEENAEKPLADTEIKVTEEISQEETAEEKMLAQVSDNKDSGLNSLAGSAIIGAALFFGLILGSLIVSRSLRKN